VDLEKERIVNDLNKEIQAGSDRIKHKKLLLKMIEMLNIKIVE